MTTTRAERIKELFGQAVDLPADERTGFLRSACGSDSELYEHIIALLATDQSAPAGFLRRMALEASGYQTAAPRGPSPPSQIGRFRIVRLIAQGGMGAVYEAQQEEPHRTVAVKVIRFDAGSPDLLRRFRHEGDILARLQHPGIAQIHETGMADLGYGPQPFFAMEYIRGRTLNDYVSTAGLTLGDKLELFAKVCNAVHYAHTNGVIHRDLKPANVLVSADGQPKIVDFGVARLQQGDDQLITQHTAAGQIVGTLSYMSPEQVGGGAATLDARSDIYALGVLLFEMLTGRLPYDLRGRSLAEAARLIADQEPTRLGSIDTVLRGDLDTIVLKSLEKERDRRYVSAADLAEDVRRYLADQPITARPQTTFYLLRKFARRNRGLVIASVAALACLVLGLIGVSILAHREAAQRREAQRIAYRAAIGAASAMLQNHDVVSARRSLEEAPANLRGWEWRHFWSRLDQCLQVLETGETVPIVAYQDTDGKTLVAHIATSPPSLQSWDLSASPLRPKRVESGIAGYVRNNNGTAEWWVTSDGAAHVRMLTNGDTKTFDARAWLSRPDATAYGHILSEDARLVLFREADSQRIAVVDLDSSEVFRHEVFLEAFQRMPAIGPENVVASPLPYSQTVELWNFRTGQTRTLGRHPAAIETVTFSPDGAYLYTGSQDTTVRRWHVQSGEPAGVGHGHSNYVTHIVCSPDGKRVASASLDHTLRIWDAVTLESQSVYHGHQGDVSFLSFSPDSKRVITTSLDRTIGIWDAQAAGDPGVLKGHVGYVYNVAFSPDGKRIASAGWDGYYVKPGGLKLWDAATGRIFAQIGADNEWFYQVAFSPDGKKFAAAGIRALTLHDAATGRTLVRRNDLGGMNGSLAYDPTGRRILVGGAKLLDADSGKELPCRIEGGNPVAWSHDGRIIATVTTGAIQLWDAATQSRLRSFASPKAMVWELGFSAEGYALAVASEEGGVAIWDVRDGRLLATLEGQGVLCAAFSPDGSRIATGGRDQIIHLWDMPTSEELAQLHGHTAYVKSLAFSPDGSMLISGSGDGTIRIWDSKLLRERRPDGSRNIYKTAAEPASAR